MQLPYHVIKSKGKKVPILVSVPHCGTAFPKEIKGHYRPELISNPDDTDFEVHRLYDFVTDMGITMIYAHYSRWVIDLNRTPANQALYIDGRIITGLTPSTNFLGQPIYKSSKQEPNEAEIERRKKRYYQPYYDKITELLNELKQEFGFALLWDAHSIRRIVPTIQKAPFPDLILGNNDGKTASVALINAAIKGLSKSKYKLSHNTPFKGGNITRHFGNPPKNIHALQLEMTKDLYMDDAELVYCPNRGEGVRGMLRDTFELLIGKLL